MVKYIPTYDTHFIEYNGTPFRPNTQLAYVIPPENHHLLGKDNKDILMKYYSHLFSGKVEFEWAFCRYLWESHIILPEIPLDILEKWEKILQ